MSNKQDSAVKRSPDEGRRRVVKGAIGVTTLAAAGTAPYIVLAREGDTLVVNGYGGEFQPLYIDNVIKPFEKKMGVKVIYDGTGTASKTLAKIRASKGNPGFDVAAELTPDEILLGGKEGLLEPLAEDKIPNLKYGWKRNRELIPRYGAIHSYQYLGLFYNPTKIEQPTSWADYWDPGKRYGDKIKGRILQWNPAGLKSIHALIMAAQLDGGGVDNMAPAWEYLKKQKPYIGPVLTGSSEATPYFENEEVWLAPYWSARAAYFTSRGMKMRLSIPKEGSMGEADVAAIPVGIKNKKLAYEFVNFRLSKEVQRAFCLAYFIGPSRNDITDWPKDFAAEQITTEQQVNSLVFPDDEKVAAKRKEWTLRWQEIMG